MAKPKKEVATDRTAQEGYALLVAPEGVTGASAAGQSYEVGEDGLVEVHAAAVPALVEHGFIAVE